MMIKKILITQLFVLILFTSQSFGQVKIIFDTDIGGDFDDLGALAMLHHFIDKGECELLAVMCWSLEEYAVSAIDAVNRFYIHPDIPIGTRKGEVFRAEWNYTKPIADHFEHILNHDSVPDATMLYRKILSQAEDNGIVIITVGPLKNIENLLLSSPDHYSDLNGKDLIHQKVKEFVIMGGQFPSGENEWNFNGDMEGVTQNVISQIELPICFSGFELGHAIKIGENFNTLDKNTPIYIGALHFSNNAPWMEEMRTGNIINNATFDQTAVLYAIRDGIGTYWEKIEGGKCVPDSKGGNTWVRDKNSKHSYLKLIMEPEQIGQEIENMMLGKF